MIDFESIRRMRRERVQEDIEATRPHGYTGKINTDGSITASDDLPPGKTWVRIGAVDQFDPRPPTPCFNTAVANRPMLAVRVELLNSGEYSIYGLDEPSASIEQGAAITSYATPQREGRYIRETVNSERILPHRAKLGISGGLAITIEAGWYNNPSGQRSWRTNAEVAPTAPSSVGEARYAILYLDRSDGSLNIAYTTTRLVPDPILLERSDIVVACALLDTDTDDPLWAIPLVYGQSAYTSIDDWIDLRLWGTVSGSAGGHEILIDDVLQTQRAGLNILSQPWLVAQGADDAGNDETEVAYTLDPAGTSQLAGVDLDTTNDKLPIWDDDEDEMKWIAPDDLGAGGDGGGATLIARKTIYHNKLGSNGEWANIQNSDLLGGLDFEDYLWIEIWIPYLKTAANTTTDGVYMRLGTGGSIDTTATNYWTQPIQGFNNAASGAEGNVPSIAGAPGSGASVQASNAGALRIIINNPASGLGYKRSASENTWGEASGTFGATFRNHTWLNTGAVTNVSITSDNPGTDLFVTNSEIYIFGYREVSVGAADLDIASISPVAPVIADYSIFGDVSNSENTAKATIEDVLELATYEMTSTATGNIDDLDIGDLPIVELRMNNASDATIRGMVGSGKGGQIVKIVSVGAGNVLLAHQNTNSSANNRMINYLTVADTPLAAGKGTATFVYDATTQRWRLHEHDQGNFLTYTPAWTASGTNPAIVNGTIVGRYYIKGMIFSARIIVTMGSSTTYGTGTWILSYPFAINSGGILISSGLYTDTGTANYALLGAGVTSTTFAMVQNNAAVNPTVPFTGGNTDVIDMRLTAMVS